MKRLLIVLLVCTALIPTMPASTAQPPDSDAPYLYYYSERLNAFVIERADGTDSRIFGEGLLHEEAVSVSGAGWSPSGEWFGFVSMVPAVDTIIEHSGNVIHVSDTKTLQSTAPFKDQIKFMRWAINQDLMFIATSSPHVNGRWEQRNWYLVDATTDTIIETLSMSSGWHFEEDMVMQSGDNFLFSNHDPEEGRTTYYRMSFDGVVSEIVKDQKYNEEVYGISETGWTLYTSDTDQYTAINLLTLQEMPLEVPQNVYLRPQWAGNKAVMYGDEEHTWFFDADRELFYQLPSDLHALTYYRDLWSPDGRYFVVWDDNYNI